MTVRSAASLLLVALALGAAPALADQPDARTPSATILHLSQVAAHTVARDRLTIELRTEASGADPRLVQAEVNRRMTAALGKARSVAAVKAATGAYDTYQTAPPGPEGQPKPPAQWHAMQTLSLTGRDFGAALALAGKLQADGLLVSNMHFDVAPETVRGQERVLTDEALNALTARAGQIATTLGLTVARIATLTVGNAMQPGGAPRPLMMARTAGASTSAPVAAAGDTVISVSVDADIALIPGK
ncbi:MAG TPA: SIMPL domain-containing protein [Stellaceae bacterium]|nr:SIMPL domain-containing protein [Stellaceae bacterium]